MLRKEEGSGVEKTTIPEGGTSRLSKRIPLKLENCRLDQHPSPLNRGETLGTHIILFHEPRVQCQLQCILENASRKCTVL